jgi:hypothetical protein
MVHGEHSLDLEPAANMATADLISNDFRREPRLEVSSIVLPFLGSREDDFSPFQYILADLSMNGAKVLIPRWLIIRDQLSRGDVLDFHAPFRFAGETYSQCVVAWVKWDSEVDGQVCGVSFEKKLPPTYPLFISYDAQSVSIDLSRFAGKPNILLRILKDAVLLKRGIAIYLKHLAPYLSRISGLEKKDYAFLRSFLIDDAARHVKHSIGRLQELYDTVMQGTCTETSIQECLNPEDYLDVFEPEIPSDVFAASFLDQSVAPYIRSIKILEKKLYTSYNALVLLYLSAFDHHFTAEI